MHVASLNHAYRLVWSDHLHAYVAVPECSRGRGKSRGGLRCAAGAAVGLAIAAAAHAGGTLPTGGQVAHGTATLTQSGSTLTVQQASPRLVTNWQSFDIAPGNTVQFVQPSAASVALNRVTGSDVSAIQGTLRANGQVFLVNPNGILFSSTARVDVGGLVASTLAISDTDFLAGRYRLEGTNGAAIANQGALRAAEGGTVALIAAKVVNDGTIDAPRGKVLLASGSSVLLDVGGSALLQVERGVLDGLVENGGAIRADGGRVLLTARALDSLSRSVVNQSGLIQARTLSSGAKGEIVLLGDMDTGTLNVAGKLDASAPNGGDGGFIETSAAHVNAGALNVDAGAAIGLGGQWLIDPYDYTINATAATNIAAALNTGTSVTVTTQSSNAAYGATGSGSGDITVASPIAKTAGGNATLTLRADRNVVVNSAITSSSGALGITLSAANNAGSALGGVAVNANLASNGGTIRIGGGGGSTTSAQAYGIGYALNSSSSAPAVRIGTNVSIASSGGDIVLNGHTTATTPSYEATKAGVYVLSGATIDSGGGNIYLSATSSADAKEFAFGVEGNSGTVTTFRTSTTRGAIVVDVNNTQNVLGSLGLVNNGNQARIQFWAPSVAHMLFRLNGNNQAAQFTQSPPCNPGYPNCGTMVIPGGNASYTSAGYNVVSSAMNAIYVFTGSASRTYDGTTATTGLPAPTSLGGPGGFNVASLGALSFETPSKNAGAYTSLVSSASNPTTYQSGSYAVAYFNQGTYTITPKALSSFSAADKVYDGTTAAAVSSSGVVSGDAVTLNATGSFAQAGVGSGVAVNITGVTLGGADASNYTVGAFGTINTTANITPAPLTIGALDASKTYDAQAYAGGNGVSYSGFVNGETAAALSGTLSYAGTSQGAINAGSYGIVPQGLTSANYAIGFAPGTLTINPATLTIGATPASRTYGAANPTLAGSVSGFVGSDTLASATTGTLSFTTSAGPASNVGAYAVSGGGLSSSSGNYVFAQAPGNATALTVTPASLAVTALDASKTYDAQAYAGGNGVSYSGFVNGDGAASLGGSLSYGGSAQGAVNAGSYGIVPQGLTSSNYTIGFAPGTLSVNPATLTIASDAVSRTYGAANPALSGSVSGFAGSDTLASATTGTLVFATTASSGSNVGTYAVSGSGLSANGGNYVFTQAAGNTTALTVTPAPLTVTAIDAGKTYDAQAYAGGNGVSYSGFVNGETTAALSGALTYGGSAQGAVNAGSYAIVPHGLSSTNYAVAFVPGTLTVSPATLTLAADAATRTYGATNPTLSGSVSGFVGGETPATATTGTLSFTTGAGTSSPVGAYGVNGGGLAANHGNYVFAQAPGNATGLAITPAPLTVTAVDASKTYDGQAFAGGNGLSYSGLVNGETAAVLAGALSYGGSAQGAISAGSYAIVPQGLSGANYAITYVPGTLRIDPAALHIVTGSLTGATTKVYDGTTQATLAPANFLLSGFVGAEGATVLKTEGSFADKNVGASKPVTVSLAASDFSPNAGTDLSNYVLPTSVSGAIGTITPATLTIAAAPAQRNQGSALSALEGTVSGFVNGETLATATTGTLTFESIATSTSAPGSYAVVGGGLVANDGNYQFVQSPANGQALTLVAAVAPAPAPAAAPAVALAPVANIDTLVRPPAAVPNFPDNARPALGGERGVAALGELNYVPLLSQALPIVVSAAAPAPSPIPAPMAPAVAAPVMSADADTFAIPAMPLRAAGSGDVSGSRTNAMQTRAAPAGTSQTPVRSANGPLDVFVIEGGINFGASGVSRKTAER